jgi:hypothetical protein
LSTFKSDEPINMPMIGEAVRKTAATKAVSVGRAKVELIGACESGLIRARWPGYYRGTSPLIPRQEFSGADIDVEKDVLILANGERKGDVYLDDADFEAWLDHGQAQPGDGAGETQAAGSDQADGGHKTTLVRNASKELWGPAGPPKELSPQQVFKKIGDHLGRGVTISKSHTLRALGLKKI